MTEQPAKRKRALAANEFSEEHERLLLDAAQLLPDIILEEVMPADSIRQRTIDHIEENDVQEELECLIADGTIKGAAQQALWRKAILDPPVPNLERPALSFGHSFFLKTKDSHFDRATAGKRLGMAELLADWQHPVKGRLHCRFPLMDMDEVLQSTGDLYELRLVPMRLFAVAFASDVPLGKVLTRIEEVRDWIRLDAEGRPFAQAAPLVAIISREEVFDAISTSHDALLITNNTYLADLRRTRHLADNLTISAVPVF